MQEICDIILMWYVNTLCKNACSILSNHSKSSVWNEMKREGDDFPRDLLHIFYPFHLYDFWTNLSNTNLYNSKATLEFLTQLENFQINFQPDITWLYLTIECKISKRCKSTFSFVLTQRPHVSIIASVQFKLIQLLQGIEKIINSG